MQMQSCKHDVICEGTEETHEMKTYIVRDHFLGTLNVNMQTQEFVVAWMALNKQTGRASSTCMENLHF